MEIDFEDASGLGDDCWIDERQANGCEGPAFRIDAPTPFIIGECVTRRADDELAPSLDINGKSCMMDSP